MEKNKWQNKNNQQANVGVYWDDIKVYHDGNIYESVFAYTEGILVEKNKNYLLIKNPETVVINDEKNQKPSEKETEVLLHSKIVNNKNCFL